MSSSSSPPSHLFIFGISGHVGSRLATLAASSNRFASVSGSAPHGPYSVNYSSSSGLSPQGRTLLQQATHVISTVAPLSDVGDPILHTCSSILTQAAQSGSLEWVGYLSTTAVYGDRQGQLVDEDADVEPTLERGHLRLRAEQGWRATGCPLHIFRLPGIYGSPGTGPLSKAATAKQLLFKQDHVFCRIHVDDICQALLLSMHCPRPGRVYNTCDDEPAPSHIVSAFCCELLGLPLPPLVDISNAQVSPMVRSFYSESRRISNARLVAELGFRPLYPSFRQGLVAQLEAERTPPPPAQLATTQPPGPLPSPFRPIIRLIAQLIAHLRRLVRLAAWHIFQRRFSAIVLVDNGSLRPGATLGLRRLAAALKKDASTIEPLSFRFADRIAPELLDNKPARVMSAQAVAELAATHARVLIVPLFLGPSDICTHELPALARPHDNVSLGQPLVSLEDDYRVCAITRCLARAALALNLPRPFRVVLVDHGSPNPAVTRVRRALAARLRLALGPDCVDCVVDCSMERRPGPAYAFNDPLLEDVFERGGLACGAVAVVPAFLFPGNHAGEDGDIARILRKVQAKLVDLKPVVAKLVCDEENDDLMVNLLRLRVQAML